MKALWKNIASRVWMIATPIILALVVVANVLLGGYFYDLFCSLLGKERPIVAEGESESAAYIGDYETKEEAAAAGNALTVTINEEGAVLLKNENALPIATKLTNTENGVQAASSAPKISVFGKNSVNLVYSGSGSGAIDTSTAKDLYDSLETAGYEVNPTLKAFYEDSNKSGSGRAANPDMNSGGVPGFSTGETPVDDYTSDVKASYSEYNDAALIVFSRIGGEGADLPRTMVTEIGGNTKVEGARNADDHYLQLDANETALIQEVCSQNFEHVIVLINSGSAMELGFLDDPTHYAYNEKIDGALWIGCPGAQGIMALGNILNGSVNPSGRTTDTYARNWKMSPTWFNFGNNRVVNGDRYAVDGSYKHYYFVDYEEGIYVGYRYYETRANSYTGAITAIGEKTYANGEEWYKANVVYPFGYGKSYTTFSQEIVNKSALSNFEITQTNKIKVDVKVTNNGTVAGKEVVQIYATAPYAENGIEKAHKVLVGFAKTELIQPGKDDTVTVEIDPYSFASYDFEEIKVQDGGYILETGIYTFTLGENAHTEIETFTGEVKADILFSQDAVTSTDVKNRFDDADDQLTTVLSRDDWAGTFPATRTADERNVNNEFIDKLKAYDAKRSVAPSQTVAPASVTSYNQKMSMFIANADEIVMPEDEIVLPEDSGEEEADVLQLKNLVGAAYDDPRWVELVNMMSLDDMLDLYNRGGFQTLMIESIGKPPTLDSDGPVGWVNFIDRNNFYGTCSYATEIVLGCTWNIELLKQFGLSVGNEALLGNSTLPYTGWYAPAVNIHRSAFGGRNWEYFSEDGFLSGKLAAAIIQGCREKGVITQLKHFAVNDQETHRNANGVATWLTEQSMREIYLKPFEIAVKEGESLGMMSSFNRIGYTWAGGDYRLLTEVLRQEWGFKGMVICDYNSATAYMNNRQMVYAGGDLNLATDRSMMWNDFDANNADDVAAIKETTKHILYATANSNAFTVEVLGFKPPIWVICMYVIDAVVGIGLVIWGFVVIKNALKPKKSSK